MRLTWIALVFVALVVGSVSPSYAQAADKPTKTFEGDAAVALVYVKADKTADFEDLMAKFKEALSKSEVAEVKQQTAGLKIFKAPNGPAPAGAALYVMIADPVVKNVGPGSSPFCTRRSRTTRRPCTRSGQTPRRPCLRCSST